MNLRAKAGIFEFENALLCHLKGLQKQNETQSARIWIQKSIGFSVILSVAQEKLGKALWLAAVRFCKLA